MLNLKNQLILIATMALASYSFLKPETKTPSVSSSDQTTQTDSQGEKETQVPPF